MPSGGQARPERVDERDDCCRNIGRVRRVGVTSDVIEDCRDEVQLVGVSAERDKVHRSCRRDCRRENKNRGRDLGP